MSEQQSIRDDITRQVGAYLAGHGAEFETGPFSDTSFVRAEVEKDGTLSLFDSESEKNWPIGSFDVPQLAEWLLASPVIRRIQAEAIREAARKAQEAFVAQQGGVGYARVRTDWLHAEADRIEKGE